jgi:hypothetical protein
MICEDISFLRLHGHCVGHKSYLYCDISGDNWAQNQDLFNAKALARLGALPYQPSSFATIAIDVKIQM